MATETDFWPCPDPPSQHQDHLDVPISEILEHGSISFGRFAVESLAWEKRSVFSHNRCKEELEKFRAPGLVAEKKAYFEEYYRKVRAMKALEAEQQEAVQPVSRQDMQNDTVQIENGVDASISEDGVKISNVRQIHISDNVTATPFSGNTEERQTYGIGSGSRASMPDATTSLLLGNSKLSKHGASSTSSIRPMNNSLAKGSKERSIDVKAKGGVASGRDKAKSDRGTTKIAISVLERQKKPSNKEITRKTNNSLVSRKNNLKAELNIKSISVPSIRQKIELRPATNVLHTMANNKPVSPSPNLRGGQVKKKQTTRLPVQSRPVQSTSRPISANISMRNTTLDDKRSCNGVAGKSVEVHGLRVRPKGGEYQTQRPKNVMPSKLPGQGKLNQNAIVEVGSRNYFKDGKQHEEKVAINPRGVSSLSILHKASTTITNRVHKSGSAHSADTKRDQKAPRRITPSWQ